jgi:NAD(P)-dependent dehydrogenase (short-subunit alcohol dehydrogenase family)
LTQSWPLELATTAVTINAISPGPTEIELSRTNNLSQATVRDAQGMGVNLVNPWDMSP